MGFFDRLFKGKEVFADRRNPDMVCEMTLCGESHILSEFDIAYEPDNSSKEYMEAYAVFSEPVNAEVENWIMQSNRKENGVVRFYRNSDAMDEGALFEIKFSDASCVHYRNVSQGDTSVKTIVMTFPYVRMGGDEFIILWLYTHYMKWQDYSKRVFGKAVKSRSSDTSGRQFPMLPPHRLAG